MRFSVIAQERAPTMATTIQAICRQDGQARSYSRDCRIARGEQRPGERKRQREHRVLELDHLEDRSNAAGTHCNLRKPFSSVDFSLRGFGL